VKIVLTVFVVGV